MIYLDNSATTALCEGATQKMRETMECFGNPSSLHSVGYDASLILSEARRAVESSLGVRQGSHKIVFCGSGTEANNLALLGTAAAKARRRSNRIITTDSEHPSVDAPLASLAERGFEIVRLSTRGGVIDREEFESALAGGAFMISIMTVNNETGAIYDVGSLFKFAKSRIPDVITHTDATQAYMKLPLSPARMYADLLTVSAHKIHGPKGIGALCISCPLIKTKSIVPVIRGGGQEDGWRSGTENMIGIAGFGGAAAEYAPRYAEDARRMAEMRGYAEEKLGALEGIKLNIPRGERAPHILNFTLPSIKSETMVHFLSSKGIAVSGGSACSSHSEKVSSSLLGFGLDKRAASCSIRVSLCDATAESDIDALAEALTEGLARLVRVK